MSHRRRYHIHVTSIAAAVSWGFFALFFILISMANLPTDVRGEMHRTAVGWAAWQPRRASCLMAAAMASGSISLMTHALLGRGSAWLSGFEFLLAFGALYAGLFAGSRPPAVVVKHEGVEIRHVRSILVPWEEIERNVWALGAAGLRGLDTDPLPVAGQARPRGRVRLHNLDVAPSRVMEVVAYYRHHPEARAELGTGAPMPAALALPMWHQTGV